MTILSVFVSFAYSSKVLKFRNSREDVDDERRRKKKEKREKRRKKRRRSKSSEETTSIPVPKITQVYRAEYDLESDRGDKASITSELSSQKYRPPAEGQFDDVSVDRESMEHRERKEHERNKGRKLDVFWYSTDDEATTADDDASITTQESIPSSYGGSSNKRVRFQKGSSFQSHSDQSFSAGWTKSYEPSPTSSLPSFQRSLDEEFQDIPQIIVKTGGLQQRGKSPSIVVRGHSPVIEVRSKPDDQMEVHYVDPPTKQIVQNVQPIIQHAAPMTTPPPYAQQEPALIPFKQPTRITADQRPANVALKPALVNDDNSWIETIRNSPDVTIYDVTGQNRTVKTGYMSSSRSSSRASSNRPSYGSPVENIPAVTIQNPVTSSPINIPQSIVVSSFIPEETMQIQNKEVDQQPASNSVVVSSSPIVSDSPNTVLYDGNSTLQQLYNPANILVRSAPAVKRTHSPGSQLSYDAKIFSPYPHQQVIMSPQNNASLVSPQTGRPIATQYSSPLPPRLVRPIPRIAGPLTMRSAAPPATHFVNPNTMQLARPAMTQPASQTMAQLVNQPMVHHQSPQVTQIASPTMAQLSGQEMTQLATTIPPTVNTRMTQFESPAVSLQPGQVINTDQPWSRNLPTITNAYDGQLRGSQAYPNYTTNQQTNLPGNEVSFTTKLSCIL